MSTAIDQVDMLPHMDQAGLGCLEEYLSRSRCYAEYGCGGSTIHAAKVARVANIIAVESDASWAKRVREQISSLSDVRAVIEHCDLGEVGEWGTPRNRDHIGSFWKYMTVPWQVARALNLVPDTVLIDGRFRVASFLYSLLSARAGSVILFDDYSDRPQYAIVEQFCPLQQMRGRMAVFVADSHFSIPAITATLAQYSIVWD
jgi:hypothetical protein